VKIENWAVLMTSSHRSFKSLTREESLKTWTGGRRPDLQNQNPGELLSGSGPVILELSEQARAMLEQAQKPVGAKPPDKLFFEIGHEDKLKMLLVESMMKALTGKEFKLFIVEKIDLGEEKVKLKNILQETPGEPRRPGWGMEYNYRLSYYEAETLSFSARGLIRTADGREISFSVQLNMSREFAARNNISIRAGDAVKDPLVINFDGTAPGLTEAKYNFDPDCDGCEDLIKAGTLKSSPSGRQNPESRIQNLEYLCYRTVPGCNKMQPG